MIDARWEHGSDLPLSLDVGTSELPWTSRPHSLWGSGRTALRGLLRHGVEHHGWRRLLVPSYYCQDLLPAIAQDIDLALYPCGPLDREPARVASQRGDVVLAAALFGSQPMLAVEDGTTVIEDHSHDPASPLAAGSRAAYAFASLRKTLPLPDGGVAWSPQGLAMPPDIGPTEAHAATVLLRLQAMALKLAYLRGAAGSKSTFRELYAAGEAAIRSGEPSGMSTYARASLGGFPTARWRRTRARNLRTFRAALDPRPDVTLLGFPFAALLVLDRAERRERVRAALIDAAIYPAVLWPLDPRALDGVPPEHVDLSNRILAIHVDQRYTTRDMERVANGVRAALEAA